jgi:hypothetical protein
MKLQFIDIIFCCIAYIILIFFVIKRYHRKNMHIEDDSDDDDDGGIEIHNLPDPDLPPGICLPPDPHRKVYFDQEVLN